MINAVQDTGASAALISSLNASGSSLSQNTATDANSVGATQDRFLTLLTTQLKNQDPLNPMDNAQITTQMAQLSTVSGIDQLNATLTALSNNLSTAQSVSATGMIGHGVLVPGSTIDLVNGAAAGGIDLTSPADTLTVKIQDAAGNTVRTLELGPQEAGVLPFAWDGRTDSGGTATDGAYYFSAQARLSGVESNPATLGFGPVNAVTPGTQGAVLDVDGQGQYSLSEIKLVM